MLDTTAVLTYAVTHQIDYYGGASRLRVLALTDDLTDALAKKQALNDAECARYGAWQVAHNEASNFHIVYELVRYIDYDDWGTLPEDLTRPLPNSTTNSRRTKPIGGAWNACCFASSAPTPRRRRLLLDRARLHRVAAR